MTKSIHVAGGWGLRCVPRILPGSICIRLREEPVSQRGFCAGWHNQLKSEGEGIFKGGTEHNVRPEASQLLLFSPPHRLPSDHLLLGITG